MSHPEVFNDVLTIHSAYLQDELKMCWGMFGIVFGIVCLNHGLNSLSAKVVFLKDWPKYSVIMHFWLESDILQTFSETNWQ